MKPTYNVEVSDTESVSEIIKERNKKIKEDCYEVIEGSIANSSSVIVVADTKQIANNAGKWLQNKLNNQTDVEESICSQTECEKKFSVQVWNLSDFDLEEVKKKC